METVFKIIFTTSLYASIAGFVILLIKWLLKSKLTPQWHYFLWAVLILKLIFPFGPESVFSLFNAVPAVTQNVDFALTYEDVHQTINTLPQEKPYSLSAPVSQETSFWTGATAKKALPYVWALGSSMMLAWLIYTNYSLQGRLKKKGMPAGESALLTFAECKKRMGIKKDIEIIIQDEVETPSLYGIIKPKILITPAAMKLGQKEIFYILLHELAHYKRKDLLVNYLLLGLQILHWFNPVIWYCFKMIRQDMEIAADDKVLSGLKPGEEKEYGKALLTVLESFNNQRLAPRLIGMVDDRRNIEKRINMIRMAQFFKGKRTLFLTTGILCLLILGSILLTNPLSNQASYENGDYTLKESENYDPESLLKFKNPYAGNNSNVGNLLGSLPYARYRGGITLQTQKTPYDIAVVYDFLNTDTDRDQAESTLRNNAHIIFALIDNVDSIHFTIRSAGAERTIQFSRQELQKNYEKDLREYAKDNKEFTILLNSLRLKILAYPPKYTPVMSSTPGIRILAQYQGSADRVQYSAASGKLLSWDNTSGKVGALGTGVELPINTPVYWSQLEYPKDGSLETVRITMMKNNEKVAEKQVMIRFDGSYFTVEPSYDVLITDNVKLQSNYAQSLDEAVSLAIKNQGKGYGKGEVATEGHLILDTEEKDQLIKAYTISSFGYFGFENGIFTKVSGSGAIPTVITFSKNDKGEYTLLQYQEPMDGGGYLESVKKMFPRKLWSDVLTEGKGYPELMKQQEAQAGEYLKSIGRNAEVRASYVEKKLLNINTEASNKLLAELTKKDPILNLFPYWAGSKEVVENGERWIYETSQSKSENGDNMVLFTKKKDNGKIVLQYQYLIQDNEPILLSRTEFE
ncbi:MAG: DUF4825 domain-containing protein [Peptococcaceae bacterium]|nr:DUF4825 domain-containing protein [Peptococcaceae bacterium]